jgi:hypothetical protein
MPPVLTKPSGGAASFSPKRGGFASTKGGRGGGFTVAFEGLDEAIGKLRALEQASRTGGNWSASIESDAPHARWVVEGTPPHIIRRRNARALRVPGYGFFASVRHPGTRPNPFMEEALDAKASEMENRAAALIDRGIDEANPDSFRKAEQLAANIVLGEAVRRAPRGRGPARGVRLYQSLRARYHTTATALGRAA